MISDLQHSERPGVTPIAAEEGSPVVFGLNLELLLLALLPLWLFLASLLPVLVAIGFGLLEEELFYPALLLMGFICHTVLLPLWAYRAHLKSERRRKIADETMSRFASRIVELYAATRQSSRVAADPRTAEAFSLYVLAEEELRRNPRKPRQAWGMIARGTALADKALLGSSTTRATARR